MQIQPSYSQSVPGTSPNASGSAQGSATAADGQFGTASATARSRGDLSRGEEAQLSYGSAVGSEPSSFAVDIDRLSEIVRELVANIVRNILENVINSVVSQTFAAAPTRSQIVPTVSQGQQAAGPGTGVQASASQGIRQEEKQPTGVLGDINEFVVEANDFVQDFTMVTKNGSELVSSVGDAFESLDDLGDSVSTSWDQFKDVFWDSSDEKASSEVGGVNAEVSLASDSSI